MKAHIFILQILVCILHLAIVDAQQEILRIPVERHPDVIVANQSTVYYVIGLNAYQVDVFQEANGTWVSSTHAPVSLGTSGTATSGVMYLYFYYCFVFFKKKCN